LVPLAALLPDDDPRMNLILADEREEFRPSDPALVLGPIPPSVRLLDRRAVLLRPENRLAFLKSLGGLGKLKKKDPSQHWQPVKVAVEPLILSHDVASGLDQASEPLGSREGC